MTARSGDRTWAPDAPIPNNRGVILGMAGRRLRQHGPQILLRAPESISMTDCQFTRVRLGSDPPPRTPQPRTAAPMLGRLRRAIQRGRVVNHALEQPVIDQARLVALSVALALATVFRAVHVGVRTGEVELRFPDLVGCTGAKDLPEHIVRRTGETGDRDLISGRDVIDVGHQRTSHCSLVRDNSNT